jgi:ABC-2 type transport system ATP-binding protein
MIELAGVSRRFGHVVALSDVSFRVARGEIVGFLGPNGAGKTTTLRIIAGFLAPDAGRVRVDGLDVAAHPLAVRARLGVLPENAPVYPEQRVRDYLWFRAALKDVPRAERRARVDEVAATCELGEVMDRPCGALSRGFRQRVGLADALIARPAALLLDEPTAGLDPNQIREFRALLRRLAPAHTVLYSSHVLPEVEAVAARVVILVKGRVVAEDTPAALRARLAGGGALVAVAPESVEAARAALGEGATVVEAAAGRLRAPIAPEEAARRLAAAGLAPRELGPDERSLEDVFAALTRREDAA